MAGTRNNIENRTIVKDFDTLIDRKFELGFRLMREENKKEHEKTRKKVEDVIKLVNNIERFNVHDIIQYATIVLLFILMMILR